MELKTFATFELKVNSTKREVTGYASIFNNVDSYGDVVLPGAYTKTIRERGPEKGRKVVGGKPRCKIKVLRNHTDLIGIPMEIREDGPGLWTKSWIAPTDLGNETLTLIEAGVLQEMSIGYDAVVFDFNPESSVRNLRELKLYEYSYVDIPANEEAVITEVKRIKDRVRSFAVNFDPNAAADALVERTVKQADILDRVAAEARAAIQEEISKIDIRGLLENAAEASVKTISRSGILVPASSSYTSMSVKEAPGNYVCCGDASLPIASADVEFSYSSALGRVVEWAGGESGFDPDMLSRAFCFRLEDDISSISSYKLLFADIIDGEIYAIPEALESVQEVLVDESDLVEVGSFPVSALVAADAMVSSYLYRLPPEAPDVPAGTEGMAPESEAYGPVEEEEDGADAESEICVTVTMSTKIAEDVAPGDNSSEDEKTETANSISVKGSTIDGDTLNDLIGTLSMLDHSEIKAGRTLSQSTREVLGEIAGGLADLSGKLQAFIASSTATPNGASDDSGSGDSSDGVAVTDNQESGDLSVVEDLSGVLDELQGLTEALSDT